MWYNLEMEVYSLHFDGSFSPWTTKVAAYGYTIHHQGTLVKSGHGIVGQGDDMSCNVAEFSGLYVALLELGIFILPHSRVNVYGDSQLVIKLLTREWKAKAGKYYHYYDLCNQLVKVYRKNGHQVTFTWKPREKNTEADALSTAHRTEMVERQTQMP